MRGADFRVENKKSLVEAQIAAFARFTFMLRWIALSVFGVSALGAFGVSWIAVGNRAVEIGTRRAIGGTRGDILIQFLLEGALGCIAGCALGFVFGYPATRALDRFADQPFAYSWRDAMILFIGSTPFFSAFAAAAAARAVSIDPILAMRTG